jgi:hypothetical protein
MTVGLGKGNLNLNGGTLEALIPLSLTNANVTISGPVTITAPTASGEQLVFANANPVSVPASVTVTLTGNVKFLKAIAISGSTVLTFGGSGVVILPTLDPQHVKAGSNKVQIKKG